MPARHAKRRCHATHLYNCKPCSAGAHTHAHTQTPANTRVLFMTICLQGTHKARAVQHGMEETAETGGRMGAQQSQQQQQEMFQAPSIVIALLCRESMCMSGHACTHHRTDRLGADNMLQPPSSTAQHSTAPPNSHSCSAAGGLLKGTQPSRAKRQQHNTSLHLVHGTSKTIHTYYPLEAL